MAIKVHLTKPQVSKLMRGKNVQLKHAGLQKIEGISRIELPVSSTLEKKYHTAVVAGRGLRLTPSDIDGNGLKEIWEKIKSGAKKAGRFYKENKAVFAPIVKKGVEALTTAGTTALSAMVPGAAPAVAAFNAKYKEPLLTKLGEVTGAYGLKLSKEQARRLLNGHSVQLKHTQLGEGMPIGLSPSTVRKLQTAQRRGRGSRLQLGEGEGAGLRQVAEFVVKGVKKAKKLYDESAPEPVKQAVRRRIKKEVDRVIETAVKKIEGGECGGEGMVKRKKKAIAPSKARAPRKAISRAIDSTDDAVLLSANQSGHSYSHKLASGPTMQRSVIPKDIGAPQPSLISGSSFRAMGGSFY